MKRKGHDCESRDKLAREFTGLCSTGPVQQSSTPKRRVLFPEGTHTSITRAFYKALQ